MDFGLVGLEYFFGAEDGISSSQVENKQRSRGSGFDEQQRSGSAEEACRSSKMAEADDLSASKIISLHQGVAQLRSNSILSSDNRQQEHMLSFSSPIVSQVPLQRNTQSSSFSYYQRMPPSDAYNRNAVSVYGSGSVNPNMHGPFAVVRGPFTPSQWIELEHQALIYKYITSNVPVPSHLLLPIKKALYPYGLSSGSSVPPNSIGWGSFHLGLSGNTDPEPGRCRRTDGKKWRCSRDAVPEQKYCERHINRGRHRSRKPVEGQTGQAVTGATDSKVVPMTSSVSTSVISSGGASNSLSITPHQFKSLQASVGANPSSDAIANRTKDSQGLSMMSCSTMSQKSNDTTANVSKLKSLLEEKSSRSQFGLVATDSLVNPSQKSTYLSTNFLDFSVQETQVEHQLRQFMDDWPKDQCDSITTWHDEMKLDSTQLSMSTPMVSYDFSSSASSPIQDKLAISPLRLSHEFKPMQMNRGGVNYDFSETKQKQVNWVPISWETSMGGPLGEVLANTPSNAIACKSTYLLNLSKEGCDGSPQIGSSPTGVLQKSALSNSLSNSSSASSPRADNRRNPDGANLYDDVLGSTLASFSTPPCDLCKFKQGD